MMLKEKQQVVPNKNRNSIAYSYGAQGISELENLSPQTVSNKAHMQLLKCLFYLCESLLKITVINEKHTVYNLIQFRHFNQYAQNTTSRLDNDEMS
jgi:hypothetical protein